MRQQAEHPLAQTQGEARLQQPDFLHRLRKPPRQRNPRHLVQGDAIGRTPLRFGRMHALCLQQRQSTAIRWPQQHRIQERRRHRLIGMHPRIGVAQALHQHPPQRTRLVGLQGLRRFRQQHRQQSMRFQQFKTGHCMTRQEHLQGFFEQTRRRRIGQQRGQPCNRFGGGRRNRESQLGRQPRRPQHPHRVFAIARFRLTNQAQHACLHICKTTHVIAHRKIFNRVIQRVGGEVAAYRIVLDTAVHVIAQQPAAIVGQAVAFVITAIGAKGGHFDDFAAIHHMRQAKPAPNQAAIAKQRLDLLGSGIGSHVKILGLTAHQQVAHRPPHQIGRKAGLAQAVQHTQCALAHLFAGNVVRFTWNHVQAGDNSGGNGLGFSHAWRPDRSVKGSERRIASGLRSYLY